MILKYNLDYIGLTVIIILTPDISATVQKMVMRGVNFKDVFFLVKQNNDSLYFIFIVYIYVNWVRCDIYEL